MKWLILAVAFVASAAAADLEQEDGVYVLTDDNYHSFIEQHEFVLIEFYAPWCGHCKNLAPEYSGAAQKLAQADSTIKLAKVDATVHKKVSNLYGVKGFPTLKFFKSDPKSPIDYNGGRTADEIVQWVEKKSGPAAVALDDVKAAKKFVKGQKVVVIGYFKDQESDKAKAYLKAAAASDDIKFGITSKAAVLKEYVDKVKGDEGIVLIKDFDEGKAVFDGEYKENTITEFVNSRSLPLVVEFSPESAQKVFSGSIKQHLLVFFSKKSDDHEVITKDLKKAAEDYRGKLIFVTIDIDEEEHLRILEFFGIKKEEVPTMRIIDLEKDMAKYQSEDPSLKEKNVKKFIKDFLAGKLQKSLKTQEVPEDWDEEPVKVLVGKNFEKVVMDKNKDVLVEFYAPWCGHCKQLAPIYDKLGEKFEKNKNVVIAKMDATENEVESVSVQGFPTIKLFKKDDNEVVDFNGERTLEALTKFVETRGAEGGKLEEQDVDDEEEEEEEEEEGHDEL